MAVPDFGKAFGTGAEYMTCPITAVTVHRLVVVVYGATGHARFIDIQ